NESTEIKTHLHHTRAKHSNELCAFNLRDKDELIYATRQQPPERLTIPKVKEDGHEATGPLTQQRAVIRIHPHQSARLHARAPRLGKLPHIPLAPGSVYNPHKLTVEHIAGLPLFGLDG